MLADAVGDFLDAVSEREFDEPLLALLRARGFTDIHFLHGSYEFGKDVIAKYADHGTQTQYVIQSKAGDLNQSAWQAIVGQIDLLKNNTIAHPNFDATLPRRAVLVLTGRLVGGALTVAQNYEDRSLARGEPELELWDRERLLEFLSDSPDAVLAGSVTSSLLALIAAIDERRITDAQIERYSASWVRAGSEPTHGAAFEAALLASKLAHSGRKDLAALMGLTFVRAVWASVHDASPVPASALEVAEYGRQLFLFYARETWAEVQGLEADAQALFEATGGFFSTLRVSALRLMEIIGLLGLADSSSRESVGCWLASFSRTNPAASQPISDRWAVSLVPGLILIAEQDRAEATEALRGVTRWVCDRYEGDGLGLAGSDAGPDAEVDYLLGASLDHVSRPKRNSSYLATVVLDLAATLELSEAYDDARNDFLAVGAFPIVPLPRDDRDQYMVGNADVPLDTSPKYAGEWASGDEWQMAGHHRLSLTDSYLGRIGRPWDQLAVSAVSRDRHWIAAIRALREH